MDKEQKHEVRNQNSVLITVTNRLHTHTPTPTHTHGVGVGCRSEKPGKDGELSAEGAVMSWLLLQAAGCPP